MQVYYDNTAELVVHDPRTEKVTWATEKFGDIDALKVGSVDQPVLRRKGDGVRINWGYQYVAVPASQQGKAARSPRRRSPPGWDKEVAAGPGEPGRGRRRPRAVRHLRPGQGRRTQPVSRWLMLAYDDIYSAQFFHKNLQGLLEEGRRRDRRPAARQSAAEYAALRTRCAAFDKELMADLEKAGGPKYAWICALAYRQSLAASKVVADANGQPLFFCKENTSNGCMGTVDVFYPQAPLPLLISPSLSKAMLIPVLEYASPPAWTWPNAPHDVGTWPQANGQVYGGAKSNGGMPVEETGNMLLLVAAVAQVEGNADFAAQVLADPDQVGQVPRAIRPRSGEPALHRRLRRPPGPQRQPRRSRPSAPWAPTASWPRCAATRPPADKYLKHGPRVRPGLDQAGRRRRPLPPGLRPARTPGVPSTTWSGTRSSSLNLFPEEAVKKEMAFYRKNIDKYGLPLDGRKQQRPGQPHRPAGARPTGPSGPPA